MLERLETTPYNRLRDEQADRSYIDHITRFYIRRKDRHPVDLYEAAGGSGFLSQKQQDAQEKRNRVAAEAGKTRLQISIGKTEAIRINNRQADPLRLHPENINEVEKFDYLGNAVKKARYAFNTLRPNKEIEDRAKQIPIETVIKKRKHGCIGHTLLKPVSNFTRRALERSPGGKRKVGRPKQTWRGNTEAEVNATVNTWVELKRTSQNRVRKKEA
ncbi:hypothetical protein EGW08_016515 [Elysia chlorotica]|uniref:Uncharacterized protein n=1 Tax=Elysia chlorotica TaxID=188477 RepID=A0A433T2G4_ELYCH|nr:hypothetical protein EGW08_016515 [Elysia chlorotica]